MAYASRGSDQTCFWDPEWQGAHGSVVIHDYDQACLRTELYTRACVNYWHLRSYLAAALLLCLSSGTQQLAVVFATSTHPQHVLFAEKVFVDSDGRSLASATTAKHAFSAINPRLVMAAVLLCHPIVSWV